MTTKEVRDIAKNVKAAVTPKYGKEIPATLGLADGTVETGEAGYVYAVIDASGQVVKAFNANKVPNRPDLKVYIGHVAGFPRAMQVLRQRNSYEAIASYALPSHGDTHTFPQYDTVWVDQGQFMPLMVQPTTGFILQVFGASLLWLDGLSYVTIDTQEIDLSLTVPTGLARYVLIQAESDGTISTKNGTTADTPELLTDASIPLPDANCLPLAAVKVYDGQDYIARNSQVNDVKDLRLWSGGTGGGGGSHNPVTIGSPANGLSITSEQVLTIDAVDIAAEIHTADAATLADDDEIGFWQATSEVLKKITWANILAALDALYLKLAGGILQGALGIAVGAGVEGFRLIDGTTTKLALSWSGNIITLDIPSVEPVNKITNGDFDTDLTGWTGELTYTLNDQFTADRAAGSVNGTSAEPTGGTRTVVDTNSKLSITGGRLSFATGNATGDGLWYGSTTRASGLVYLGTINLSAGYPSFGFDTNQSGGIGDSNMILSTGSTIYLDVLGGVNAGTLGSGTYQVAIVLRGTGSYYYIKGETFTNWTLLWIKSTGSTATLYPAFTSLVSTFVGTADNIRIPTATWLPTPLAYDTFTRADGAIGNSETTGPDSQTTPSLAWTSALGTAGVASNKLQFSALSGGLGVATLPTSATISVLHEAALVRSAGDVGLVVRWVDASNYVKAIHNGTNVQLIKVVAGTPTTLINTAATYGAGYVMRVICDATKFRVYYNNAFIGSEQTISDAALQAGSVGVYTSDLGNTFDNILTFARSGYTDAPFETITITRDTGTKYAGAASAKIVAGYDYEFVQSVNVGNTSEYTLTGYAYTTGAAVTSADLELYFDTGVLSTTFTDMGGGWYKMVGTLTGVNAAKNYGVRVKAGKTVYVDSFTLQSGIGDPTSIRILNSGSGVTHVEVEGTTTLNAGLASEPAAISKGAVSQSEPIHEFQDADGDALSSVAPNGAFVFPSLADADADPGQTYYSTTQSALAFKDSGGTVHALY